MLAQERQKEILEYLKLNKIIKISNIVNRFDVSHETARRDVEYLKDQGFVKRVHGGAVLLEEETSGNVINHSSYGKSGHQERVAIGRMAAAKLINDGDSILLGVGSTVLEVAKHIKYKNNITVVTNSIHVILELINTNVDLQILGGGLNHDELTITGFRTLEMLGKLYVDKAFISAGGITFDGGISVYSNDDAVFSRLITQHASKVILVANSNKFGKNSFATECTLNDVDIVVSDINLAKEYISGIKDMGKKLLLADPKEKWPSST